MNTCKACKHRNLGGNEGGMAFGICSHPMVCQPIRGKQNNRTLRIDGVLTCDEGGGIGDLMTAPDFGCIHHEQK